MGVFLRNKEKYNSGDVYYYIDHYKIYGLVFLARQANLFLVSISEELPNPSNNLVSTETILNAQLYTVAWFSDIELLSPRRLHYVGKTSVVGDFTNRAGLYEAENGSLFLSNIGQRATWKHTFRSFSIRNTTIRETLYSSSLPKGRPLDNRSL